MASNAETVGNETVMIFLASDFNIRYALSVEGRQLCQFCDRNSSTQRTSSTLQCW